MGKLIVVLLCGILLVSITSNAQHRFFTDAQPPALAKGLSQRNIDPAGQRFMRLDVEAMKSFLQQVPLEGNAYRTSKPFLLRLPIAAGDEIVFTVSETQMMEAPLAAKFPNSKTYAGTRVDGKAGSVRFDMTPLGFHAMIHTGDADDIVFIDPSQRGDIENYIVYKRARQGVASNRFCTSTDDETERKIQGTVAARAGVCAGTQLRTFRLALACSGEYAIKVCENTTLSKENVLAAMLTTINRVNSVYETELSIRLVLVANNDLLIYLNPSTDPYTNVSNTATLNTNNANCNTVIGQSNYDIGHVFNTDDGGIAGLGVVCTADKGRGSTGLPNPVGDPFDIDYVAHEIGHQFGATHTFNAQTGNCGGGNRSAGTAVEPGSGITIMAYAGICGGTNNLSSNSIPYFHTASIDQINEFVSTQTCQVTTPTANTIPVVNAGANYTIPASTPFFLTGSATDGDNDALTYSWEQIDIGPAGNWNAPVTTAPLFRSFPPVTTAIRYFPRLSDVIANTTTIGELLPAYAREMNFRLTARDGKGTCAAETQVTVVNTGIPFQLTYPSASGITVQASTSINVQWNVAGTSSAPINCENVMIELSTDGGQTFPIVLDAATPNTGFKYVTLPAIMTNTARIRVRGVGNIFYDMSDNDFEISTPDSGYDFNFEQNTLACPIANTAALGEVAIASILGYTGTVSLTTAATSYIYEGVEVTIAISPATVAVGGNAILQLTGGNNLRNGTYKFTLRGLSTDGIQREKELQFTVSAGTGPAITTHPQAQQVCMGRNVTFSVTPASPVVSYQWQVSINGGATYANLAGQTNASLQLTDVTASLNGNRYRVILTGQCNTTISNGALLTVYALPAISLSANPATAIMPGTSTTLTYLVTPGSSTTTNVTWYFNGTLTSNAGNNHIVRVDSIGNYQVRVEDGFGCTAASQFVSITGESSDKLFVYPNPSNGQFIVTYYNSGSAGAQTVTIYTATGQKVYTNRFAVNTTYQLHTINLSHLAKGVYHIMLSDENGKKIKEQKLLLR